MNNLERLKKTTEWLESDEGKETREYADAKYSFFVEHGNESENKERFKILAKQFEDQPEFDSLEEAVAYAEKRRATKGLGSALYATPPQASNAKWLVLSEEVDLLAPEEFGWIYIGTI